MKPTLCILTIALIALPAMSGAALSAPRTSAENALLEKAIKACNGPQYPSGARPVVNYGRGTFQCVEPGSTRR